MPKINDSSLVTVNKRRKSEIIFRQIYRDRQLYLLLIPFLLFYILFVFRPMGSMVIAFKDYSVYKGIAASPWVGLKHFREFFESEFFTRVLRNTVLISLYQLVIGFPLPIIFALLLNEVTSTKYKRLVQTFSYLPYFISTVVIAGMVTLFLSPSNGIVNIILDKLGMEKIYFLTKPEWFRTIYTMTNVWIGLGYNSVVYISALSGVDQSLYEACTIDGGGKMRQMLSVTIPGILPTIVTMFLIQIGNILNVGYELIIMLYQPATYETADTISTYVYRIGIEQANYSLSTAVSFFNSIVGLILVVIANYISKKVNNTGLW